MAINKSLFCIFYKLNALCVSKVLGMAFPRSELVPTSAYFHFSVSQIKCRSINLSDCNHVYYSELPEKVLLQWVKEGFPHCNFIKNLSTTELTIKINSGSHHTHPNPLSPRLICLLFLQQHFLLFTICFFKKKHFLLENTFIFLSKTHMHYSLKVNTLLCVSLKPT